MEGSSVHSCFPSATQATNDDVCGICLSIIPNNSSVVELDCKHAFHASCAVDWFRTRQSNGRCPICRNLPTGAVNAADRSEEDQEDQETAVVAIAELFSSSVRTSSLHHSVAPWLYTNLDPRDRVLTAMKNRYMRRRRLHRKALYNLSRGATSQSEVDTNRQFLLDAGYNILLYVAYNFTRL